MTVQELRSRVVAALGKAQELERQASAQRIEARQLLDEITELQRKEAEKVGT